MSAIVDNLWSDLQEYTWLQSEVLNKLLDDAAGLSLDRWRRIKPTTPEEKINFYALYSFELFEGAKRHLGDERKASFYELKNMAGYEAWQKVLDFGCGIGTDGLVLAEAGLEVHFLDVVSGALNFARWRSVKYRLKKIKFYPLQPVSQKYDCIICVDVFGHTARPATVMRSLVEWTDNFWLLHNVHDGHEDYHEPAQAILGPLASHRFNYKEAHLWTKMG